MSKPCIPLAVVVLMTGLLAPAAGAGGVDAEAKAKSVTLRQLRKAPESFRGVPCEFLLIFHGFSQVYNPYFTRFIPETYLNFSAWGGDQDIWVAREYHDDFSFLFVRKENPNLPQFLKLQRFDRFKVVGTIRDTFKGNPWIEVQSMTRVPGKLNERTLIHRVRGDRAMRKNRPRIAVKEYDQALREKNLPPAYACDVLRNLGMAFYRARDFAAANRVFVKLASLRPGDRHSRVLAVQSDARAREQEQRAAAGQGVVIEEESAGKPPQPPDEASPGAPDPPGGKPERAPHRSR